MDPETLTALADRRRCNDEFTTPNSIYRCAREVEHTGVHHSEGDRYRWEPVVPVDFEYDIEGNEDALPPFSPEEREAPGYPAAGMAGAVVRPSITQLEAELLDAAAEIVRLRAELRAVPALIEAGNIVAHALIDAHGDEGELIHLIPEVEGWFDAAAPFRPTGGDGQ